MTLRSAWIPCLLAIAACGPDAAEPRAQWKITLATDAPLPLFGDRVLIEILNPDGKLACENCRRLLDASDPSRFPVSFGVRSFPDQVRLRARLHRSRDVAADGLPSGTALIDTLALLPPAPGFEKVTLTLHANCFDVPADPIAGTTCDPTTRTPVLAQPLAPAAALAVAGSWPAAQHVDCPETPPPEMVCIPGGVFRLGSAVSLRAGELRDSPERIVQLGPFAIDIEETTLATVVPLLAEGKLAGSPLLKSTLIPFCTFEGFGRPETDPLPVNCITWEIASSICEAQGKRLPTEAEWEYVASNGARDDPYPWGGDDDVCAHAYVARGDSVEGSLVCQDASTAGSNAPTAAGMPGDVSSHGVHNLAGNIAEWTADDLDYFDGACWLYDGFPLVNPRCDAGPDDTNRQKSFRGGWWNGSPYTALSAVRQSGTYGVPNVLTGVRCVKSFSD